MLDNNRHLRLKSVLAVVAILIGAAPSYPAETPDYHVGSMMRAFHPQHERHWRGARTEALITRLWYPVDRQLAEEVHDIGPPGKPIFRGQPTVPAATISANVAAYPLIVLSHGTGGSADTLEWLGAALASKGYIVAGLNHPGNTALEPLTPEGFILWWERATDATDVLDALFADPDFGAHIDRSRIGAAGFSLGGYTVFELAGARTDRRAFLDFCNSSAADAICAPPEMQKLPNGSASARELQPTPQTVESLARSGNSFRDPRIRSIFAMAPALGEAFKADGLSEVNVPVAIVAGEADAIAPVGTNALRFERLLSRDGAVILPGAGHYTLLDSCVPEAVERLPLPCKDGPGVDREEFHRKVVELAIAFFARTLPDSH